MDGTRPRRTHDGPRQRWYAHCRSVRFARYLQFVPPQSLTAAAVQRFQTVSRCGEIAIRFESKA